MSIERTILQMLITRSLGVIVASLAFLLVGGLCASSLHAQSDASEDSEPVLVEEEAMFDDGDEEVGPALVSAPDRLSISPVVLKEQAKARDIINRSLTVRNHSTSVMTLYADVYDVDPSAGAVRTSFGASGDRTRSLANWIEITRGVIRLEPGESAEIPYLIHVNVHAEPGEYFAEIVFREGRNRELARTKSRSEATLLASVTIGEDIIERINLGGFLLDRSIVTGGSARFSYALQNNGNREIAPQGSIRIFDRAGREVATVPVNAGGDTIAPESMRELAAEWPAQSRFGKYKAFLDLQYGMTGSVNDSLYFWVIPWRDMMIGLFLLILAAGVVTYLIHARSIYARPMAPVSVAASADEEDREEPEVAHVPVARVVHAPSPKPTASSGHAVTLAGRGRQSPHTHVVRLGTKK